MDEFSEKRALVTQKIRDQVEVMIKDKELAVLKCHLLVEEMLREYCYEVVASPEDLKAIRLTFQQLMMLAKALTGDDLKDHWIWEAINHLNQMRNKLAHALTADESVSNREKELILVIDKNLPERYIKEAEERGAEGEFVWKLCYFCSWSAGRFTRVAHTYKERLKGAQEA